MAKWSNDATMDNRWISRMIIEAIDVTINMCVSIDNECALVAENG